MSPSVSEPCTVTEPRACVCAAIASSWGRLSARVTVTVTASVAPGAMLAGADRLMVIAAGPPLVNDPVIVWPSGERDQQISLQASWRLATRRSEEHKSE